MSTRVITIENTPVTVEVAVTASEQRTGLMHRESLESDHGMLFELNPPRPVSMWMKNTLIDLDAIFVNNCGVVVNTVTMKKGTLDLHRSQGSVAYVIEVPRDWAKNHQIVPGTFIADLQHPTHCVKTPLGLSK